MSPNTYCITRIVFVYINDEINQYHGMGVCPGMQLDALGLRRGEGAEEAGEAAAPQVVPHVGGEQGGLPDHQGALGHAEEKNQINKKKFFLLL